MKEPGGLRPFVLRAPTPIPLSHQSPSNLKKDVIQTPCLPNEFRLLRVRFRTGGKNVGDDWGATRAGNQAEVLTGAGE